MPTTKIAQRPFVSLALPRTVATLITYAGQILKAMTGNPSFPSPSPTLAVVQQAVDDLQTAEAAALARTKGAVQARDNERTALVKLLQLLGNYVQSIADADAETAEAVIKSSGLSVRKVPTRNPEAGSPAAGVPAAGASRERDGKQRHGATVGNEKRSVSKPVTPASRPGKVLPA